MDDRCSLSPSQIVMYTTRICGDCVRVQAFFEANHISYMQVPLDDNEEAARFVVLINNGLQTVPTIVFPDGTVLVEPSWEELRQTLRQ